MPAQYLISKFIDPFFALGVGLSAAALRINREEKEKGRTTSEILETLQRRINVAMAKDEVDEKATAGKST